MESAKWLSVLHLEEANHLVDIGYLVRPDLKVRNWASSGK